MADTTTRRRREKIEPERWQRLKTILADALEQDSPEDRTAFVERRCAEDVAVIIVKGTDHLRFVIADAEE